LARDRPARSRRRGAQLERRSGLSRRFTLRNDPDRDAQWLHLPYLYDESKEVAKAYPASCTPDFFLFDRDRRLAYHAQFDGSRPGSNIPLTGSDLRAAAQAL